MPLFFLLLVAFMFLNNASQAQSINGGVFESGTRITLSEVKVQNLRTGQTTLSDSAGKFTIHAKTGDLLATQTFSYHPDTLLLIDLKYKEIFLQPKSNLLNEVTVTAPEIKLGDLRAPEYHGQSLMYQRDENGQYKGGILIRLWYWNKDSRKKRRAIYRLKDEEIREQINKIFHPLNLATYTPLKGEELQSFADLYRPTIQQYKSAEFNLPLYLSDCFKQFKSLPLEKRKLAPLIAP